MIGSSNVCMHIVCKTVLECNETMPVKNNLGNKKKAEKDLLFACMYESTKQIKSQSKKNGCRPTS